MTPPPNDRRYAIAEVAIQLFMEHGYDAITAEDIARASGIGTRTFFRYFATKEQAAFPDHEERIARFRMALQARAGFADPVDAAIEVGIANAKEYFEQPALYRPRYKLVRDEPALRDHERIADRAYELAIEEFLVKEFADQPQAGLIARVVAGGLVAAVNHVLDSWAFDEGTDFRPLLESAKQIVARMARAALRGDAASTLDGLSLQPDADLVLVFSADDGLRRQIAEVLERHRAATEGHPRASAIPPTDERTR